MDDLESVLAGKLIQVTKLAKKYGRMEQLMCGPCEVYILSPDGSNEEKLIFRRRDLAAYYDSSIMESRNKQKGIYCAEGVLRDDDLIVVSPEPGEGYLFRCVDGRIMQQYRSSMKDPYTIVPIRAGELEGYIDAVDRTIDMINRIYNPDR